jgi:malate dehydrogenase (oxaloacetate-decarboxylating)(NADP+)
VAKAYGLQNIRFGADYLIPKPLDPRVLLWVAPAVARAAMETGVARLQLDLDAYREQLEARMGTLREIMRIVFNKAKANPKRIVLAEGENGKILRAACQMREEGLAIPVLIGDPRVVQAVAEGLGCHLEDAEIIDPHSAGTRTEVARRLFELRCRKGVTETEAWELAANPNYAAAVLVEQGQADGMVTGLSFHYPDALRPPLQVVRTAPESRTAAGVYLLTMRNRTMFFADTTVNIDPNAETLAQIGLLTAQLARDFNIEPRVALLSFSNFGSTRHPRAETVRRAVELIRERDPDLIVDGEMQANTALSEEFLKGTYSFSRLHAEANVLIFPNLEAGNIGYKLVQRLANAEVIGPILVGMDKPVYVLQRGDEVKDIVNAAAVAVVQAQNLQAQTRTESAPWQTEKYPLEDTGSWRPTVSNP